MSGSYDDILHLPHPTSKRHPRMSRQDRAAQFSPFAALTGYEAVVKETERLTDERAELTEDEAADLDIRLRLAMELGAEVAVTWFRPDSRKRGGSYVTATGYIKRVEEQKRLLVIKGGAEVPLDGITAIQSPIFNSWP